MLSATKPPPANFIERECYALPMSESEETQTTESSAASLKAAYRLLRELNALPEPLSIENMAQALESALRYGEAVALISGAATRLANEPDEFRHELAEFQDWAKS